MKWAASRRSSREAHFLASPFERSLRDYRHILQHLADCGYDVHLWTMEPIEKRLVDELAPGLPCRRLPLLRGRHGPINVLRTIARGLHLAVRHPEALFTSWGIHVNLLCGTPLRAFDRRCVFLLAGLGSTFSSDAPRFRLARILVVPAYRWLFGGVHSRVLVQNADDLDYVCRVLRVRRDHVYLMHGCGVDPREFPFERLPDRRPHVVLVPARLLREKGIFEAARASRILLDRGVDHELWFSCDIDPANPYSLTRAEVNGLPGWSPAIRVLGHRPSVLPLLQAARVVCLPTYREGLPTALIEAAAFGRPIVTTDVIGPRDIVRHEHTGLLVPVRDPHALADALERVLLDDALAERLRQNAHAHFTCHCTRVATLAQALPAYRSLDGTGVAFRANMKNETASNTEEARPLTDAHNGLLRKLFRELVRTERSASRHGRREAERYGTAPPAQALRAVADHADRAQRDIAELIRRSHLQTGLVGTVIGESFSIVRELVTDQLVDAERSYRGTLLDIRQGMDLADFIRRVADASGQVEIGGFCTRWLLERGPLVDQVAHALAWFASHPQRVAQLPRPRVLGRLTGPGRERSTEQSQAPGPS